MTKAELEKIIEDIVDWMNFQTPEVAEDLIYRCFPEKAQEYFGLNEETEEEEEQPMANCKTRLSVARRTIHFVDLHLAHEDKTLDDFDSFEDFLKFLKDTGITKTCGFNINKRGYMETLKFCYSLREVKNDTSRNTRKV